MCCYQNVHQFDRFVPSYGSIQGADMTLQTKRGNAMDTASLTIALLRASNIPARYAYGTVETTKERVMNWVGGVNVPEAATNLMQQGGIPTTLVKVNGVIKNIRFEQTWVEAWVDFEPSRGMKHVNGDTWIPMDASFKQYTFTAPTVNLQQAVPFDAQGLANTIQQGTTVNADGSVQNMPQQSVQDVLTNYQVQLQNYLQNQQPNTTVGDVLGLQNIKILPSQPLSAGLPYQLLSKPTKFVEIADSQRLKFKYELYTSNYGTEGTQLLKIEEPTVKLAGKKLALSFNIATQTDQNLVNSYVPQLNADGEINLNQLPTSLPGYLIHMLPEFTLDSEVKSTSTTTQTMGQELISIMGYYLPQNQQWETTKNFPIAGQYEAIALDLQGASFKQSESLKENLNATKTKLENHQTDGVNKYNLVGDLLYATIFSYFALNDLQDKLASDQANIINYRAPSYGLFLKQLVPLYWFGVPRNVLAGNTVMDVDNYAVQTIHKMNNDKNRVDYHMAAGVRISSMEHIVPEQLLLDAGVVHAVSAVKAIAIAMSEGQRILTITKENIESALNAIQFPNNVKTEITNAVFSGKQVITHQNAINFYNHFVFGYIILDPETGLGAYKIGTGENGVLAFLSSITSALVGYFEYWALNFDKNVIEPIFQYTENRIYARWAAKLGVIGALISVLLIATSDDPLHTALELLAGILVGIVVGFLVALAASYLAAIIGTGFLAAVLIVGATLWITSVIMDIIFPTAYLLPMRRIYVA